MLLFWVVDLHTFLIHLKTHFVSLSHGQKIGSQDEPARCSSPPGKSPRGNETDLDCIASQYHANGQGLSTFPVRAPQTVRPRRYAKLTPKRVWHEMCGLHSTEEDFQGAHFAVSQTLALSIMFELGISPSTLFLLSPVHLVLKEVEVGKVDTDCSNPAFSPGSVHRTCY